jgi:threonyl-tRNA synthetase
MERFIGVLTEHFAGAFPIWLAPVQVAVLSISEKTNPYAEQIVAQLKNANLRVEANLGAEKIGAKIRQSTMDKIPYMLVLGEKEMQGNLVAVRHRTAGDQGVIPLAEFEERMRQEVSSKSIGVEAVAAVQI